MDHNPTSEQIDIINESGNRVVIANPGSGKTYTLSVIIKNILLSLYDYQGLIAISYTNKASEELKKRSLNSGQSKKKSFFGTLDKFYISQVLMPFLPRVWGKPKTSISVVLLEDIEDYEADKIFNFLKEKGPDADLTQFSKNLKDIFVNLGLIPLETVGWLSNIVFEKNSSCRKYLKSRYTHIIVDEYQDCGINQHRMFKKLKNLGLIAIAVGDANQSIFGYAGKNAEHLLSLVGESDFKLFTLTRNLRCHTSIVNYSMTLISDKFELIKTTENRMFYRRITGTQLNIQKWLERNIDAIKKRFNVSKNSDLVCLVRTNASAMYIQENARIPVKVSFNTNLDEDSRPTSNLYKILLNFIFTPLITKTKIIENFSDEISIENISKVSKYLDELRSLADNPTKLIEKLDIFKKISEILIPHNIDIVSNDLLMEVLNDIHLLENYIPAKDDEVNVMTLHKSKGLEFDVVLHWDLYDWILPNFEVMKGLASETQCLNLHYVGITRAKKACFLLNSTSRLNSEGSVKSGEASRFLFRPGLRELRDSRSVEN